MDVDPKAPGPRFCWHCYGLLNVDAEGGCAFALVRDVTGLTHRVHKQCVPDADGVWVGETHGGMTVKPIRLKRRK